MDDEASTIESLTSPHQKMTSRTVSTAVTTRMLRTEEVKGDHSTASSGDDGTSKEAPRYYYINDLMKCLGATPSLGWESERYYDNINGLAPGTNTNHDVYEMCVPTCWPRHLLMITFETELPLLPGDFKFYEWKISFWEAEGNRDRISVDYCIPVPCKGTTMHVDVSSVLTEEAKKRSGVVNGVIDLDHPYLFEFRMDLFAGDDGNLRPVMAGRSKVALWNWEEAQEGDGKEHDVGAVGENGIMVLETRAKTIQRDLQDLENRLTMNAQLSTRVASHVAYELMDEAERLLTELEETEKKLEEMTHLKTDAELPHHGRCHLRMNLSAVEGEGDEDASVWLDVSHLFTRRAPADIPNSSHVQCMRIQPSDIHPVEGAASYHNPVNLYISVSDLNWRNTIDSTAVDINVVPGRTTIYAHLVGEDLLGAPWKSSRIGILGTWCPDGSGEPEWERYVHLMVPAMYHWSPAMHIVLSTITVEGESEGEGAAFALLPVVLRNQGLLQSRRYDLPVFQHSAGDASAHGGARCGSVAFDVVVVSADPAAAMTDGLADFASPEHNDEDILKTLRATSLDALFEGLVPMDVMRLEIPILNRIHSIQYQYVLNPSEEASHEVEILLVKLLSKLLRTVLSDDLYNAKRLRKFATTLRQHLQLEFLAHTTVFLLSDYLALTPDRLDWSVSGEAQLEALDLLLSRCFMLSLCVEAMSHKDQHQHLPDHELDPHKQSERDAVKLTSQTVTEEIHHVIENIEGLLDCVGTIVPDLLLRVTRCTAMLFPAAFAVLTERQTITHLQKFVKAGKSLAPDVRDEYGTGSKEMVDGFLLCFVHILETDKMFITQSKEVIDDTMEFASLLLNDADQRRTPLTHMFLEHHTLSLTRTVRTDLKDKHTLQVHKAEREEAQMAACQNLIVSMEGVIFLDHCGNAMQRVLACCCLHLGSWLTTQHVSPVLTITCEALAWHVLLDQLRVYFGTEDLGAPRVRRQKEFLRNVPKIMTHQRGLIEQVAADFFSVDAPEKDAYTESHMWRNLVECCCGMLAVSVVSIRASAAVDTCKDNAQTMGDLLLRAIAWAISDISANDHVFEHSTIVYVTHVMITALDIIIGCRLRFKLPHLQRFAAWCQVILQRGLLHLSVFEAMKHHQGDLLGQCALSVFAWAEPILVITKTIRPPTRRASLLGHPLTLNPEGHEIVASDVHQWMQDFIAEIYGQYNGALSNERKGVQRWGDEETPASKTYLAFHDKMRLLDELVGKYCQSDRSTYSGTMLSCATLQQLLVRYRSLIQPWRLKEFVLLLQHEVFRLLELSQEEHVQTPIDTQRELACCLQWAVIAESWAIGMRTSFISWDFKPMLHACLSSARLMKTTGLWEEGRYVCELAYSICSRAGVLRSPIYVDDIASLHNFKDLFNDSIAIFGDDRVFHLIYALHVRNHPILGVETWLLIRMDPKAGHDGKSDIAEAAPIGSFVRFQSQVQDMFPDAELHFPIDAFPIDVARQSVQIFPLFDMAYLEEPAASVEEAPPNDEEIRPQDLTEPTDVAAMAHNSTDPHYKQKSAGHVPSRLFTMVTLAGSSKSDAPAHEDEHPVERGFVGMITFNVPQKEDVTPFIGHVRTELTAGQKTILRQLYLPDQWLSPLLFCTDVTIVDNEIVDSCEKVLKAQQSMVTRCTEILAECSRRTRLYAVMLSPPLTASDGEVMFTSLQSTLMHVLENLLSPDLSLVVGHQHAKSILEDVFEKRLDEYTSKRTELMKPGSGVDREQIDEMLPPNPKDGGDEQMSRLLDEVLDPKAGITRAMEQAIRQLRAVARNDLERQQCLGLETLLYGRRSRVHL